MTTLPPPDRFVLDGSVTLAWLFLDEQDPYADAIVARLPNLEMLVPRLWHLEVANVLLVGERRRRVPRPIPRNGCRTSPGCRSWSTIRPRPGHGPIPSASPASTR